MTTTSRLRIIVTGLIAQYPLGGVTWDYLQYLLGLSRLGHEVYYFEDTGEWPYDPDTGGLASARQAGRANARYLARVMERFGLGDRWSYRVAGEEWHGLATTKRRSVRDSADLLLNVSGSLARPADYRVVDRLVYIDSDPVFTQIQLLETGPGAELHRAGVNVHDVHFSFGERLPGTLPPTGHDWQPTRQPVVLEVWEPAEDHRGVYTTVMNWTSYAGLEFGGETYGQKNEEMIRFLDLPARVAPVHLELALNEGKTEHPPHPLLEHHGWSVVDPASVCPDLDTYRSYIRKSKGEWSVAKNGYVKGAAGWFSCRSACYLAAGRPVIVQDTGFAGVLPSGEGVLPFSTPDEAARAVHTVEADYERHARTAREIARSYFRAEDVLADLIERSFASTHSSTHQNATHP